MESLLAAWRDHNSEKERFQAIGSHFQALFEADAVDILTAASGGSLILTSSSRSPELIERLRLAKGVGLVGAAYTSQELIQVSDELATDSRNRPVEDLDDERFRSAIAIPYHVSESLSGVVYLRREVAWAPLIADEIDRILREVTQVFQMFEAFKVGLSTGSHESKLDILSEVARTVSTNPYLEEVLQLLVNITAQRFNYRVVTVRLLDHERQELILRATQATNKAYQRKRAIKLGESIAGKAIQSGAPVFTLDVLNDEDYIGHDLAEEQGLRSMICIPLIVQDRPVGVMSCYTGETRQFTDDEISVLMTLAQQTAVTIEHSRLQVRHTLMQEMHHRVKNNLQQVASLLRLQMRQSHYKTLEDALTDSLARIQAIASVHELLSRDDLDHVSIRHIAEMLCNHQQQSFILPDKSIKFSVRGDEVHLNMNQATQVALILNEMIQNAVEHGFANSREGEIHITVEDNDGEIGLWVSNDGDPLKDDFDPQTSGQLGLQIIRSLSGALGGTFKIENRIGWTVCEVIFTRQAAE